MTIPYGVTVRKTTDPIPSGPRPRNLLEAAANEPDREKAKAIICTALGISPDSSLAAIHLTWPERWAKFDPSGRLVEIGNWLRAECYECMDLVQCGAVDTLGD